MSGRPALIIPAQKTAPRDDAHVVAPWLRTGDGKPGAIGSRPWIATFPNTDFVHAFQALVTASRDRKAGVPDPGWTPSALDELVPHRDWAEPPVRMLGTDGLEDYPIDTVQRASPLEGEVSVRSDVASDGVPGPDAGTAGAWLRKLYLPAHQHFHIISCQVVCGRPHRPRVAAERVLEVGVILRRLVRDRAVERWQDWIPGSEGLGAWVELADVDLNDADGVAVDPAGLSDVALGSAEAAIRQRLGLSADQPVTLVSTPLSPLPAAWGDAARHTARWAYLPLSSSQLEAPQPPDDALATAQLRVAAEVRAALGDPATGAEGDLVGQAAQLWTRLNAPLAGHAEGPFDVLIDELLPSQDSAWQDARDAMVDHPGRPLSLSQGAARQHLERLVLAAVARVVFHQGASPTASSDSWSPLWQRALLVAQALAGSVPSTDSTERTWLSGALGALHDGSGAFAQAAAGIWRDQLHTASPDAAPADGASSLGTRGDPGQLLALMALMGRVRCARMVTANQIYVGVPVVDLDGGTQAVANTDERPPLVASLSGEISAWAGTDAARDDAVVDWGPLTLTWLEAHKAASELERRCSAIHDLGAAGGGAYAEVVSARRSVVEDLLDPWLAGDLAVMTDGEGVADFYLVREQPLMGLLVHPTLGVVDDDLDDLVADVISSITSSSDDEAAAVERRRQDAPVARLDASHLYCAQVYARVAGETPCEETRVVWSPRSEVFSLAEHLDILGVKPVAFSLPDLPKLLRDIPRIPKAGALPFAAITSPPDSGYLTGEDPEDTAQQWGIAWICSFGIPVFTICAWILFKIIFSILLMIGFSWMLLLKFCIPVPVPKK